MENPIEIYLRVLVALAQKRRSTAFRLLSAFAGWAIFLILVPVGLIWLTLPLDYLFVVAWPRVASVAAAGVFVPLGLSVLGWASYVQWRIGAGTPAYTAPTQQLVVSGPYCFCRNPIQLGAMCYYLGLGSWFGSLTQGVACFLVSVALGSTYHHFVEEKELTRRFGEPYLRYKKTTPFLFPRMSRRCDNQTRRA